ncbi:hypothetical protein DFH28DRAFT_852145, partial [Melampsora americana]
GEIQILKLRKLNHILCPVASLKRRLRQTDQEEDTIFSYLDGSRRVALSKIAINSTCLKIWDTGNYKGLLGHSLR